MRDKYLLHHPKKFLGQNYLIDDNICRNIIKAFKIKEDDVILEIGAGKGEITKHLIEHTHKIISIEIDKDNTIYLQSNFPELKIIEKDFLLLDLEKLRNTFPESKNKKIRIIGNIPYNITSQILFKLIDYHNLIEDSQLMIQEEVAQRIIASPGSKAYGILSIMVQIYSNPKLLFKVSRNCFYPKPKVDSRIVYFNFNKNLLNEIHDIEFFRKFIRTSFGARRKTLRNTLKNLNIDADKTKIDFDFSKRAEGLSINELIDLSNKLEKKYT